MDNRPIGVFDSGVGGLSVWLSIAKLMPNESIIYFADIKNCPYGYQSKEEILGYSVGIIDKLLNESCKLIVVACNTATSNSIDALRKNYKIPIIGIEPAIKPAAMLSKTGFVGVLATEGTLKSDMFNQTTTKFASNVNVTVQIGHGLVELVENGLINSKKAEEVLDSYLSPMAAKNIDQLVLGCTHYPFLIPTMKRIVGDKINIIDPSPAIARQTKKTIEKFKFGAATENIAIYRFLTYERTIGFDNLINKVLDELKIVNGVGIEVVI